MVNKQFSERLNKELDDIGVPQKNDERVEIFAKLIKVPKFKAEAILTGHTPIDLPLLEVIANEFEVNVEWLIGKSDKKHN